MMRALVAAAILALAGCNGQRAQRVTDNIDLPFVSDPGAIGEWQSVDFVETPDQFSAGQKHWEGELSLKKLVIAEDGKTNQPWWTWTRGVLIHHGDRTAAKYFIKQEGEATYMFLEWKSGDYSRGKEPLYYVLKKT